MGFFGASAVTPDLSDVLTTGNDAEGAVISNIGGPQSDDDAVNAAWVKNYGFPGALIRHAAGVPSGSPTSGELPLAVDTTVSPGTLYFWDGVAWSQLI